jgi:hypothetical protein
MESMSGPVAALEAAEVGALVDLYQAATTDVVEACGIVVEPWDDCAIVAATRLDVLALNRAVGMGAGGPPDDERLRQILRSFQTIGSPRFFVQVAPFEGSEKLESRLTNSGLRHYNNWMRLSRDLTDLPPVSASDLEVRPIGLSDADAFSAIVSEAFGYPSAAQRLVRCTAGRPGWRHYLVYEDQGPIAGAAMFLAGDTAWFGFAGTVAEWRGRGAQTALVVRRLHDAAAEGCRLVSVETAEQTPDHEAPSYRNLRRLGFSVSYRRPNYLWTP